MRIIARYSAVPVLDLFHPYRSGRTYVREGLDTAIAAYNKRKDFAKFGQLRVNSGDISFSMDVSDIAFIAKDLRIHKDVVLADIYVFDTPNGNTVKQTVSARIAAFQLVGVTYGPSSRTGISTVVRVEAIDKSRKEGTFGWETMSELRSNSREAMKAFVERLAFVAQSKVQFTSEISEPYHDTGLWFVDITRDGSRVINVVVMYKYQDGMSFYGVSGYTKERAEILELAPDFRFTTPEEAADKALYLLEKV